jgi:alkylation response protein AidB-like acyl-CoA dehydrogenase
MISDILSDHQEIYNTFKGIGEIFPTKELRAQDKSGNFDRELWAHFSKHGVHGLLVDSKYKGKGFSAVKTCRAVEGLANGCSNNGLLFASVAHLVAGALPMQWYGSLLQKKKYLSNTASGKFILANAITELKAGSDVFNMEAIAAKKRSRYILNAEKRFVTNAPIADAFIVYALTDKQKGFFGGVSAFIVKAGTVGVKVSAVKEKMGLRTAQMADVTFKNVELEEKDLLGPEGAGSGIFNTSMQWERVVVSAFLCGQLERVLTNSLIFLKKRKLGSKSIFEMQSTRHTLAEIKTGLMAGKSLLYNAAKALDQKNAMSLSATSMAKLFVSEKVVKSIREIQTLYGGYGYLTEADIEREYRDAYASLIYSGTSSIQKNIIAGSL